MIYDLAPFTSEYRAVASGGMAAMEQRDGLIGARRSDGCMLSTRQGDADPSEGQLPQFHVHSIVTETGTTTCIVKDGWVMSRDPALGSASVLTPWGIGGPKTVLVTDTLYAYVTTTELDLVDSVTLVALTAPQVSVHAQPAQRDIDGYVTVPAVVGAYYYPIADFVAGASGRIVVAHQYQSGGPILHVPGRTGHTSSLKILDCDGVSAVAFLNFEQGMETTNLGVQEIEAGCDGGTTSSAYSPAATGLSAGLAIALG